MKERELEMEINYEFDPVFETMWLLYGSVQGEQKEDVVRKANELGADGEAFYKKYYTLTENYIDNFRKNMKENVHMDFFFRKGDEEFFLLMTVLLTENRRWLESMEGVTEGKIRSLAAFYLNEDREASAENLPEQEIHLDNERAIIDFLTELDLEDCIKWRIMQFMENPVDRMEELIQIVKENIPAFEEALSNMEHEVRPFVKRLEEHEPEYFQNIAMECEPGASLYLSFAAGAAQVFFYTRVYEGIFAELLMNKRGSLDERKSLLLTRLKALSDRSKLDILGYLKTSSKYNLELAQSMNLSPSTMSHHMNVLFACDLVGIEKRDGRVYYFAKKEAVQECLQEMENLLL